MTANELARKCPLGFLWGLGVHMSKHKVPNLYLWFERGLKKFSLLTSLSDRSNIARQAPSWESGQLQDTMIQPMRRRGCIHEEEVSWAWGDRKDNRERFV